MKSRTVRLAVNQLGRRAFLQRLGAAGPALFFARSLLATEREANSTAAPGPSRISEREAEADLIIIGGGVGGCAAALAAARNGLHVILTEETDWLGGQLTSQAVPPDENPWIETIGGTRAYLELRRRVREYYRSHYPLTQQARATAYLNPGNGWVSRLCAEPRVWLKVLQELLEPFVSARQVRLFLEHKPIAAAVEGDHVKSIQVRNLQTGGELLLHGRFFADATELGELLPLTRTEYVTGSEARSETRELHARALAAPANHQAFTFCFALEYLAGQDHRIQKPEQYNFWRDFTPSLKPAWPGRLLSLQATDPINTKPKTFLFDPEKGLGLWSYRRIIDRSLFARGSYAGDLSLVNWPQNDFFLGNLYDVNETEVQASLARSRQLSLSLLYWLQTEAPRPDGGTGWPGLRLRPDIVGSANGLAKYPYVRESRRIRAEFTVLEQHLGADARALETGIAREALKAVTFPDSVGIGSYRIDLHPTSGGDNYLDISSVPFQIPLGALIPRRVENLLPACKNLGVTHITNGCFRLHPVEWNIGEAVGTLASFCVERKTLPRAVRNGRGLLHDLQALLHKQGVPLTWPKDLVR